MSLYLTGMVVLDSAGLEISHSPSPGSAFPGALGYKAFPSFYSFHICITSQYGFLLLSS